MSIWHRAIRWIFLLVLLVAVVTPAAADRSLAGLDRTKFEPAFLREVLQALPSREFRFLVSLEPEADLSDLPDTRSVEDRRVAVVARLQATAQAGQAGLLTALEKLKTQGHVSSYQSLWIVNRVAVTANRTAILALATDNNVRYIRTDRWQQWITPEESSLSDTRSVDLDWGIEQIRADQVWSAFRIDGEGVVVATMDSGVDWLHPILLPSYRGWHGDTAIHSGNWYDATDDGAIYPVDGLGHGTHVTGLLTGQNGVGVAPGARWIAARAFNNQGYGLDSWIHTAFQWLLAPAGNPALAPDIVNNSWSNSNPQNEEFRQDVQALLAAGILPIFAAGNNGPDIGSIGAPASYPESLAVGATDPDEEIAPFSGRGPSPFGGTKPEISAPGVELLSTLPGGIFGQKSGTSMAAPLVSGVAALLRQADPDLTADQIIHVITSTAVPIGSPSPNLDAGWGRVDALAATGSVINPGYLEGTVRTLGALPLAGATVRATEHGIGTPIETQTDSDGFWTLSVLPGTYDLEASAFGFAPAVETGVTVLTGTTTSQLFTLHRLPGGQVEGQVVAAEGGQSLPAVIRAVGTPVTTTADISGTFALDLPAGTYTLTAELWGYRIDHAVVDVHTGQDSHQDFSLDPSPHILLVDSGAWYYGSEIDYYETALDDLGYLYRQKRIKYIPQDTPTITDLLPYDAVVWSSPADSPGLIGAGEVISGYLAAGGNLILSGQNIGFWESGASGYYWSAYFRDMLQAKFLADAAEIHTLSGTEGELLETLTFTLNEEGSAENQSSPDVVAPLDPYRTSPLLDYSSTGHGGLAASLCLPYRTFYLSFGFEGIAKDSIRSDILGRALDWFGTPRPTVGVALTPAESRLISPAGTSITHTIQLRNTGELGEGDSISLSVSGASWPTTVITPTTYLSPCETTPVQVRIDIPAGIGFDQTDEIILTARSAVSSTLAATTTLLSKTPAPILLVDDDRWYDQETKYQTALEAGKFGYDYWDTHKGPVESLVGQLSWYPMVLWFTGYDWYAPLTNHEIADLEVYLSSGGRLFLSSQDALYYHADSHLAKHYLGILDHQEDVTPTITYGAGTQMMLPDQLALDYPFPNLSDGMIPNPGATADLFSDRGMAAGLSNVDPTIGWKTSFFSFPFEALPDAARDQAMDRIAGWLSWLGGSDFETSSRVIPVGGTMVFSTTLRNDGSEPATTSYSNTVPAAVELVPSSLAGGSLDGQTVHWEGVLPAGGEHLIRFEGTVSETFTHSANFSYEEHDLTFHRDLTCWVDAPDLSSSTLEADPASVLPGRPVTYTLVIQNSGLVAATAASAIWTLPADVELLLATLQSTGGNVTVVDHQLIWTGELAVGESATVSLAVSTPPDLRQGWLSSAAVLDDGETDLLVRASVVELRPLFSYLPIIVR